MSKKDKAFELYKASNGEKPLIDIANELEASPGTVRGWKSRYKWDELINKTPAETKCNATTKKRNATRNVAKGKEVPKAVEELNANSELTEQQKLFCLYYLQSFNATQSYLKAYGCGYNTAMVNGNQALRNTKIKDELTKLKKELQTEQFFTIQDIINSYAKQAFSDITDFVEFKSDEYYVYESDDKGIKRKAVNEFTGEEETYKITSVSLKGSEQVDGTLIQEVKKGKDGVSVKLWDKQKAMEQLVRLMPDGESGREHITVVDPWSDRE